MKHAVKILLVIAIGLLAYLCVMCIYTPIHFDEERGVREKAIIANLVNIRKAQIEFKNQYGRYTASCDTLVDFIKNGKIRERLVGFTHKLKILENIKKLQ